MRVEIRKKLINVLKGKTSFGDRVYMSRKLAMLEDESIPGVILVYASRESSEVFEESPRTYKRSLSVSVELIKSLDSAPHHFLKEHSEIVPPPSSPQEDLEKIEYELEIVAESVERIITNNPYLDGLVSDIVFEGYEFVTNEDGIGREGAIKLSFSIIYKKETGLSEEELQDFDGLNVSIQNGEHNSLDFQTRREI